jgi:glycosyltransferase involved in cell wall biosynthesis
MADTITANWPGSTTIADARQGPVDISVIVPVHNEAENVRPLANKLHAVLEKNDLGAWEVLWVEDHEQSDDGTADRVDQLARERSRMRALHLRRSYGQSAALAAGFDHARGNILVPMDGDLQNDPHDIPRLVERLDEGYDAVSGWRKDRSDPWSKRLPSRIQTWLAMYTGPNIHDFGCTLKAYRAEAINDIDLYGEGHRYIPSKLYDKGYDIGEIVVNHRERKYGESRYGVWRLVRGFVDLLFHWFWVRFSTRPLHFLGTAGMLFMGAGGAIGAVSVAQRYLLGVPLGPRTPRLILTVLLIVFGLQLLVFGVLAEMLTKLYYRDDTEYRVERVVR